VPPGRNPVHRLPLRVAEGVLASPLSGALQAQQLREGLVTALAGDGFCLDRRGDFEALLHLRVEIEASGESEITLTVDNGAAAQIDEFTEKLTTLPATSLAAELAVQPLLRDLEHSAALHDLTSSAQLCP
jgi:hypothetical protein